MGKVLWSILSITYLNFTQELIVKDIGEYVTSSTRTFESYEIVTGKLFLWDTQGLNHKTKRNLVEDLIKGNILNGERLDGIPKKNNKTPIIFDSVIFVASANTPFNLAWFKVIWEICGRIGLLCAITKMDKINTDMKISIEDVGLKLCEGNLKYTSLKDVNQMSNEEKINEKKRIQPKKQRRLFY